MSLVRKKIILYRKGHSISFNLIYWTPICGKYYFGWKNVEKYGKTAVLPGGYGRNEDIPHGRLRPDMGYRVRTYWDKSV